MRILVVDDDADFRALIHESMPGGVDVTTCHSSMEALRLVSSAGTNRFELALVDLNMAPHLASRPECEGIALARRLIDGPHSAAVILVSSERSVAPSRENGTIGVVGCLKKPIDLNRLARFVTSFGELLCDERTSPDDFEVGGSRERGS